VSRLRGRHNAVWALVGFLGDDLVTARLSRDGAALRGGREARARRLRARWDLDLAGFLNGAGVAELRRWVRALELPAGSAGEARQRLWAWGAALERRPLLGDPGMRVQPVPDLRNGRLFLARPVCQTEEALPTARAARWPAAGCWPRPVPPPPLPAPAVLSGEPDTVEALLARADGLLGVRLGARGPDKGGYGRRVSQLLGIPASTSPRPDWRGLVEVKTLAVTRAGAARWRIVDGPAISMRSVDAAAKLKQVLWVVRVDERDVPGAPVLSWYYQELDPDLAEALERSRHLRPKGGAGTQARGWYLRRDFFAACGLLRSLNGE
jgi:hypothetical protein